MDKKLFKNLEIIGVLVVFGLAFVFHFIYEWTNASVFSILFGAVNESVWENTKIFLIAYAIWALIEVLVSNVNFKPFVVAKVVGLYFIGVFIIVLHYISVLFVGESVGWFDITLGVLSCIFSQLISYKLVTEKPDIAQYFIPSLFLLGLFLIGFFSFTVFPPHLELFRDERTGFYGIVPEYVDKGAAVLNSLV